MEGNLAQESPRAPDCCDEVSSSSSSRSNTAGSEGTRSPSSGDPTHILLAISDAAKGRRHHQHNQNQQRQQQQHEHMGVHTVRGDHVWSAQTLVSPMRNVVPSRAPFIGGMEAEHPGPGARRHRRSSIGSYEFSSMASSGREKNDEASAPMAIDLRAAIRSKSLETLEASLRGNVKSELMAKNASNGAGLLMLAASSGEVPVFLRLASAIKTRMGTKLLARQLRYEDDNEQTLMFYAVASSPAMFSAVKGLVTDTIGVAGLAEQLRHNSAQGANVLMKASHDEEVFKEMWALLDRMNCLEELKDDFDKEGKNWVLYAAEAGNRGIFDVLDHNPAAIYDQFKVVDARGWNGFMYAARGRGAHSLAFLRKLRKACLSGAHNQWRLEEQLTRNADDADHSTMLMHAAFGGRESYVAVCEMMREAGCAVPLNGHRNTGAVVLSWAAQGGDIAALNAVAGGIKTASFPYGDTYGNWYSTSNQSNGEEGDRLLDAVQVCTQRLCGVSLFMSAVESGRTAMLSIVAEGVRALVPEPKECWTMLCGKDGNPLAVAASKSVQVFKETLHTLQEVSSLDSTGELDLQVKHLLLPEADHTPMVSAVYSEEEALFDEVLGRINGLLKYPLSGAEVIRQVGHSMRGVNHEQKLVEKWISAKMLARVLEAAKNGGNNDESDSFDVTYLDSFVELAVDLGAFEHIRALIKIGCHLSSHFPALLSQIGTSENETTECIIMAVTHASNPFVEFGVASYSITAAMVRRQRDHAALARLQQKIGDLALELIEQLPHSVNGIGEELAKGEPDLEPFYAIGKVKPSELLGFIVVGWMLEGSGQPSAKDDESRKRGGLNALAEAVRSGPRALELLSEPLVLDYLDRKFTQTLPAWSSQNPFKHNINQVFYSYTHQAQYRPSSDTVREEGGHFQRLLLMLQGFEFRPGKFQHRTILPGLQFTLAGIMGKPVSYYVVPAIRMAFVVLSYLGTIGLYLSCVTLRSQDIPANEWAFYVVMAAVAWREALEFSNASKFETGVGESIERYFLDKWNFLDVTTVSFVFIAFLFRMVELATGEGSHLFIAQLFLASTAPLLSSRVLFLSQIGRAIGPMTQVIFSMLRQLGLFSFVIILVMLGFAATFSALYGADTVLVERKDPTTCDINDHPIVYAFGTLGGALLTLFASMLGEFSFDVFYARYDGDDGEDCGGVIYEEGGVVIYVMFLVITSIMLLNLLIAVLSTAHAEVDQNASKEFNGERAKFILQSGEDVKNDVLPPPFNLVKPLLGLVWPVGSTKTHTKWSQSWDVATGALHRMIFAVVVGLGAFGFSTILWILSYPLVVWNLSQWLEAQTSRTQRQAVRRNPDNIITSPHTSFKRSIARPQWRSTASDDDSGYRREVKSHDDPDCPVPLSKHRDIHPISFRQEDLHEYVERVFFLDSGPRRGPVSTKRIVSFVPQLLCILVCAVLAAVLCFFVLPVLSIVLWVRGLYTVAQYVQQARSKNTPWGRRQVDLGEEEEWSVARAHAIIRNRRYWTANSSEHEFNVDALLKTTTGMTMEDLRQHVKNLKSTRRQRALGASLDAVLSQFPSEGNGS